MSPRASCARTPVADTATGGIWNRTMDPAGVSGSAWQREAAPVAIVIGGPDGIDAQLRAEARETIRLSSLTLPHALARVLLAEQLYRAWSVNARHPYHRE